MKYLNLMAKIIMCCSAMFLFHFIEIAYAQCPSGTLKDMLDFENQRVIKRLTEIENMGMGYQEPGILLCNGDKILSDWVFKESIHPPCAGQHIYIFEKKNSLRAVIWIEKNGKEAEVPPCPNDDCTDLAEAAHVISYDVYTWREVQPGAGVVILEYPTKEWVDRLKSQKSACTRPR